MAAEIVMPRLSDSMEEGTILKWLKSVGDEVAVGDELVEIETDKANMVYEADAAGTLTEIVAQEGDTLPIGEVIARVGEAGEAPSGNGAGETAAGTTPPKAQSSVGAAPASAPPAAAPPPAEVEPTPDAPPTQPEVAPAAGAPPSDGDGRVKASPLAKRIAKDAGLDLTGLQGSGPGGRIVKADVEKAASGAPAPAPAPAAAPPAPSPSGVSEVGDVETAKGEVTVQELTKIQQVVARRMAESKATAPHFYLSLEIDMSRAVEARGRIKASTPEGEVVPSFNDMVVKASAIALREFPRANGAYRDGRFELYSRINVGIAVAGQDALIVPTIFDADRKGLRQISAEARALAGRVRDGSITPPELSGGTFTVSNLGMFGIDSFAAVINTPQAGILSVGAITEQAVVRDGELTTAHMMSVTLACDHRILYGADGAEFLSRIRSLLEEPIGLAL
jgi:pyruvate dehydrogenase E2 component (dihydrolipoamide acetyltransferase)